jgi:acyl-homoserine-lactone acylase
MRKAILLAMTAAVALALASDAWAETQEQARLKAEAARTTIIRDDWGIAHVHGKTDADAVFAMVYAQAEDDFNRVEMNYVTALGRTAEVAGHADDAIWLDLRQKLFIDPEDLKADYAESPLWLKAIMDAWADGLNYYLATHFEPWMALSFTEGSIGGGDVERVSLKGLQAFYDTPGPAKTAITAKLALAEAKAATVFKEPSGSNGIAIAPQITRDHHALLLINPHTSFYFRSELQMSSDEGLNVYGAATWGQPFLYQGFNEHVGFMHTSTGVDAVDEFLETVIRNPKGGYVYRYGTELRPVAASQITIPYRTADGAMANRTFTVFKTHHGPIIGKTADGKWIAMALMNTPVPALSQSFLRTKTTDYASFLKVAAYNADSSNNTLFADDKGEIAFLAPQFIPKRDNRFDYTKPVDGSDPATDWQGNTPFEETPHLLNPPNGWAFNTNDWPYSAAGPYSPKKTDFPRYMDMFGENGRGLHATRLLTGKRDWTLEGLRAAAYDSYLPVFERLLPGLIAAYDALPQADPLKTKLAEPIAALRAWDLRWGADSIPTAVAVFWGEAIWKVHPKPPEAKDIPIYDWIRDKATPAEKLAALSKAVDKLTADFGTWRTPWGQINRFQRINDDIVATFHDDLPSSPVPFTSSQWGSLASFGARAYLNTKKYYGTSGNSFVAVVEFGPRVRAIAVTAGGESGHPGDKHFTDEAHRYASGQLREVYFYPDQLVGHTERSYRPGE